MSLSSTMFIYPSMPQPPPESQPLGFASSPSRPRISTSMSDQFLSARVDTSRRTVAAPPEHRRRPSSNSPAALDSVPEDRHLGTARRSPTSPLRPAARYPGRSSSSKGKEREAAAVVQEHMADATPRRNRAEWVMDVDEVQKGAKVWSERQRVVLIIGSPSVNALAPLLYNPAFSGTLLLIGSKEPLPEVQALLSPSHLSSGAPVYPTVQRFRLPSGPPSDGASHIPAIVKEATALAQQFHSTSAYLNPRTRSKRRDSDDSTSSGSGNLTPPLRTNKSSAVSVSDMRDASDVAWLPPGGNITRGNSETSLPRPKPSSHRSFSRNSMFGRVKTTEPGPKFCFAGGSPFDTVINIIPPHREFAPDRALQDMLQQAVVFTTGVMPTLTRKPLKGSGSTADLPISLLHVLPQQVPGPLPAVLESFLLSFVPSFSGGSSAREIWGSVITTPVISAPRVDETVSGVETLLFGGVRCPSDVLSGDGGSGDSKPRAFLSSWTSCIAVPGLLAEARRPAAGKAAPLARSLASSDTISSDREPLFSAYSDAKAQSQARAQTQAQTRSPPLPDLARPPTRSKLSSLAFSSDSQSEIDAQSQTQTPLQSRSRSQSMARSESQPQLQPQSKSQLQSSSQAQLQSLSQSQQQSPSHAQLQSQSQSQLQSSSQAQLQGSPLPSSPGVPELDPSHSSCSSWSGFPDSASEVGEVQPPPPPAPTTEPGVKGRKAIATWFRGSKKGK